METPNTVHPVVDGYDQKDQTSWRFEEDLPELTDDSPLARGLELLETYSKIPRDEIPSHLKAVRNKAFAVFPYPCIGRWRFLTLPLVDHPLYPDILEHVRSGEALLDAGCCFGHTLRRLAADGAPPANLTGVDLDARFVDLGYELFRDRDRFGARFVAGDMLSGGDSSSSPDPLAQLDGQFGIIHASAVFHLFGYDVQVRLAERLVRFFRSRGEEEEEEEGGGGALLVGQQVGTYEPLAVEAWREQEARGGEGVKRNYHHNVDSFQTLWDKVGETTGTRWKVTGELRERQVQRRGPTSPFLMFAVKRVS